MRRHIAVLGALMALGVCVLAANAARSAGPAQPHFQPMAIFLDSESPIAAYQVEVEVVRGEASFVGIEGGEAPLDQPPHYDPRALSDTRIVLAAFDTEGALTPGRHRVATLHVRQRGDDVRYRVTVTAVADANAQRVQAIATIEPDREEP